MKKFLTVLTVVGAAGVLTGCSSEMNIKKENFINNIQSFQSEFDRMSKTQNSEIVTNALNKYILSVETPEEILINENENLNELNNDLKQFKDYPDTQQNKQINMFENSAVIDNEIVKDLNENNNIDDQNNEYNLEIENDNANNNQIENNDNEVSILYNLSEDISDSCDEFCQLKKQITDAIIETDNLIKKLQNNEISLTKEQRMFIDEQSKELKNLGDQLSNITTELSIHLSDLSSILNENGNNINDINLKYLILLNNLVNGNEMLQSGLSSLNMINQLFNLRVGFAGNNLNHILYGFKRNDEPAIFRDFYKDKNGNWTENNPNIEDKNEEILEQEPHLEETEISANGNSNKTIDSYKNKFLETNIDSYNNNLNNLDRFFNTALFDNQFMYGNRGGFPYNMYYGMNPYMNSQNTLNNAIDCVDCNKNTEYNDTNANSSNQEESQIQQKKRFKLSKNIDTYKDENEPTLKEKFSKIKSFFKFELER